MSLHESSSFEKHKDVEKNDGAEVSITYAGELGAGGLLADESGNAIQYRTCSWQRTAALLFSEYICLAIMSFPWSYSVLGLVPGVILTIATAASVQYTSLVLWKYCLAHPEIRDVCDIAQKLFRGSKIAYNVFAVFFIGNNIFICALHCLVGARYLNTMTNNSLCTVAFSAISGIICFLVALPRPLAQLSGLGTFSAVTMGIAVFLAIIFSGIQGTPAGYTPELGLPIVRLWPAPGTTFVAGVNGWLNICYTFVGQITLPSFIAEMKEPKDFPKALWAVTLCEIVVFTLCGAIMYHFVGEQYITAPAFGSLKGVYLKVAFSFAIPTIIFLGSLYANVTARFIFFRVFNPSSKHRTTNTTLGWGVWAGILAVTWIIAFILAEIIPFFSDMLSLICSLFDAWFGFLLWSICYFSITPANARWATGWKATETVVNILLAVVGIFIGTVGTYASIDTIIADSKGGVLFKCSNTGFST
ncbi:transmembrane amino acid transporter protein-domain-containing protein [Auriculariales sp. MPI-PUGE-AT-0066]|nr:transmembrane amino acid transporter protein-domain-containing protein [Auriculariales sp. MPI-PUGE-AT-0066]